MSRNAQIVALVPAPEPALLGRADVTLLDTDDLAVAVAGLHHAADLAYTMTHARTLRGVAGALAALLPDVPLPTPTE